MRGQIQPHQVILHMRRKNHLPHHPLPLQNLWSIHHLLKLDLVVSRRPLDDRVQILSAAVAHHQLEKETVELGFGERVGSLLLYRIVSRIAAKKRPPALLAKSTPLIAMFVTSWAAGEVVRSLFGEGDSSSKVC